MIHRILCAGIWIFLALNFPQLYAQSCTFSVDSDPNPENYVYSVSVSLSTNGASTSQAGPSCTYQVNIEYEVQVSGTNPPPNLYTLQGSVVCYGQDIFFNLPLNTSSGTIQASTASLNPAQCDTMQFNCGYVIEIEGPGISAAEYPCVQGLGSGGNILPVDLLSFNGDLREEGVHLTWTVASESNNFGFFAQRSANGTDWIDVGFIAGRGDAASEASYELVDAAPLPGYNYYRLKQVDYNGNVELFSIIAIELEASLSDRQYVFPNPFGSQLTLTGPLEEIEIYDELGRVILRKSSLSTPQQVSVHEWEEGLYIMKAIDSFGNVHYQKLIK